MPDFHEEKDSIKNGGDEDTNQEQKDIAEKQADEADTIEKTASVTKTNGKHIIHCLTIVGQIEGHYILPPQNKTTKYEHVIPQLVAIEQDPEIEGLLIILNTVGGDVEAGLAIAELVSGMKKPTVSIVLGGGHSIGVPLACSAKYSFIAPSASMTVHPVRMNGLVLGVPQALSYIDRMQSRIIRFVCDNSKMTPKRFRELMMQTGEMVTDVGTVLDGDMAVKEGLIDGLGGLSDAIDRLYKMIEEKAIDGYKQNDKNSGEKSKADKTEQKSKITKQSGNKNTVKPQRIGRAKSRTKGKSQLLSAERRRL